MVMGNNKINDEGKCRQIAGKFDDHTDAAVQCGVYCPMEHIPGFTRNHWMPPLGECLCRITQADAMADEFVEKTQNTNETPLLASNYITFRSPIVCENFILQNVPSTQLVNFGATSCVKYETAQLELKSSWTFLAINNCQRTKIRKVVKLAQSSFKKMGTYLRP